MQFIIIFPQKLIVVGDMLWLLYANFFLHTQDYHFVQNIIHEIRKNIIIDLIVLFLCNSNLFHKKRVSPLWHHEGYWVYAKTCLKALQLVYYFCGIVFCK